MENPVQSNTTDLRTASLLAEIASQDQGTLFTAVVHKMGEERGNNGSRLVYGDDRVHVLIWTGFSYHALIARSHKMLEHQLGKGRYIERLARAALNEHEGTTIQDVCHALQEVRDQFRKVLSRSDLGPMMPSESVWEPLVVDGQLIQGSRIYRGKRVSEDPRAPVPGTIYVQGVKLGEKILSLAPNGPWKADSKPKTLVKRIIKESLPVGLYCQYRLDPTRVTAICVGAEASRAAKEAAIGIDPDAIRTLFKIAP